MVTILRIVFLVLVVATLLMNLGRRRRLIVLTVLSLLMVLASVVAVSLTTRPGAVTDLPASPVTRTLATETSATPTRVPDAPSFESACKLFLLVAREIDSGNIPIFADRKKRFDEIRVSATFPASPVSFLALINTYTDAVDSRLGMDDTAVRPTLSETDVAALERAIRRARDDMLSECRARQG